MHKTKMRILYILLLLCLTAITTYCLMACKKDETKEIEKIASQQKQSILDKIKKGEQLSGSEIYSLASILAMQGKYDQGINTLQGLERAQSYKDLQYEIHFALARLNIEKAMTKQQENNRELITAFDNNLNKGFAETPDRALAFYKRGTIYSVIGCIANAQSDLQEAINLAGAGDLILWGDGIFLKNDKFIQIVRKQLEPLKSSKDNCILEESKSR